MIHTPTEFHMHIHTCMVFYANNGTLDSPGLAQLQSDLYALTVLFDRVGLQTKFNKIVVMVCQPCHIVGGNLKLIYMKQMTSVEPYFWERQWKRGQCPEYDMDLAARLLAAHLQAQNGKERPPQLATLPATP